MRYVIRRDDKTDRLRIYPVTEKERARQDFCETWVVDNLETAKALKQHAIDCGA